MSAELYTLMQIAAALLRIDNDRGDEEQKTVTYILMKLRNMRLIFILSYHFSPIRETPKSVGFCSVCDPFAHAPSRSWAAEM